MADSVSLDLIDRHVVTNQIVLTVGYDVESLTNPTIRAKYKGPIKTDHYGRLVPVHAHGTINMEQPTSSSKIIIDKVVQLFDRIINPDLLVRRLSLSINNLINERMLRTEYAGEQLDLFTDYEKLKQQRQVLEAEMSKERRRQEAILKIKKIYGKNAILKGLNFTDGATQRDRNRQIGGHHE